MNNLHNLSGPLRSGSWEWVRRLARAMPRILFGSVLAAIAARFLIGAVAWLAVRVLGHPLSWAAPGAGAVAAGLLLHYTGFRGRGGGTGTDVFIAAQRGRSERPSWQLALTKLAATAFTIGSGGSGGLVGPALLIGSGVTPLLGRAPTRTRPAIECDRMVLAAGAAAAVAVLWGAPVASALLACEIIFRQRVDWPLVPSALAGAAIGSVVYRYGGGAPGLTAVIPETWLVHLLLAAVVAAAASLLGLCLIAGLRAMERLSLDQLSSRGQGAGMPWRALALLALGGFATVLAARAAGVGVLGFASVQTISQWIAEAGQGWHDIGLAAGKTVGTVATVGSGASGGVVGPALHIGAATGRGLATLFNGCGILLGAAGMAGCLAAVSNVPLAAAVLMVETFGPATLPYALVAAGVGFGVARSWVAYSSLRDSGRE